MKDYSAMSDFEINKLVGIMTGEATAAEPILNLVMRNNGKKFDPCNNPADAWPIITKNSIVISPHMRGENPSLWLCFDVNNSDLDCLDKNPLRAAMIVYLQMMEQKK